MWKLSFIGVAFILSIVTSTVGSAADLGAVVGATTQPLGALLNPNGIGTKGNLLGTDNLRPGGKGGPRDGLIEPADDFALSSQSDGGGSYAVTVNKKLLSF